MQLNLLASAQWGIDDDRQLIVQSFGMRFHRDQGLLSHVSDPCFSVLRTVKIQFLLD
jgi:hypothetical protein